MVEQYGFVYSDLTYQEHALDVSSFSKTDAKAASYVSFRCEDGSLSYGVGVERTFPVHSPKIAKIEVVVLGNVRRAKLYYLRDLRGKAARIKSVRTRKALTVPVTGEAE